MPNTDFFDDDLVKQRQSARRIKMGPGDEPGPGGGAEEGPTRGVSDFNLTRMARHKEQVENNVAHTAQELERLRQRQENLEKERKVLEELRKKQADYERGKQEITERLNQSLIALEKEELKAEQLLEVLGATRKRFRAWLTRIEEINEDQWPEDSFRDELYKALAIVEDTRVDYNKAMSRVEALMGEERKTSLPNQPVIFDESRVGMDEEKSFSYWLKAGMAASLPIIITLVVLSILHYMHSIGLL